MKKENKLAVYTDPKKIGATIIDAAIEKHRQQQSEKVLKQVHDILERIQTFTLKKQQCESNIELFRTQIEAIEKGQFSFNDLTMRIIFQDDSLNREWIGC